MESIEIADSEATTNSVHGESAEKGEDQPQESTAPTLDQAVPMDQGDQLPPQPDQPVQLSVAPTTADLEATITTLQKNKEEFDQAYADLLKQHHQPDSGNSENHQPRGGAAHFTTNFAAKSIS